MNRERVSSPALQLPSEINKEVLSDLRGKYLNCWSVSAAVAERLQEDGRMLQDLTESLLPENLEAETIAFEYKMVGVLVLETRKAWVSEDYEGSRFRRLLIQTPEYKHRSLYQTKSQVELWKEDKRGFHLLKWWTDEALSHFGQIPRQERQAVLIARVNGYRRYRQLYQSFLAYCGSDGGDNIW